jgi:hypothetical protein
MKLLFAFTFKILLITCCFTRTNGQEINGEISPTDSLEEISTVESASAIQQADTAANLSDDVSLIRRFEISLDYLKLVSLALPAETKLEGGIAIITKLNLAINIEIGYGAKMPENHFKNAEYRVEGMYGRAGLSYIFPFNPSVNFYLGARYGMSRYEDEATYTIESSLWDPYQARLTRTGLSARWAELIVGSESQYKGNFYLGFIFRLRAMISQDNFSPLEVYAVPGYGRTMDKTIPALNLYIKYMIGF